MNSRQRQISKCLAAFIDRAYHPDFVPTEENWNDFFSVETNGKDSVPEGRLSAIKPLMEAKGDYDLQIKMVFSECAEWWAKGWGWANPLNAILDEARKDESMKPYVQALEKIQDVFISDPIDAIKNFTGFSQMEKNKYFTQKAA